MQCPMTTLDCVSCDEKCLLQERKSQSDPFRRGSEMRTCDDELRRLDMAPKCVCFGDSGLHASTHVPVSSDIEHCDLCGLPVHSDSTDVLTVINNT